MKDPKRRKIAAGLISAGVASVFPKPALALSENFLLQRGDVRVGLLSNYPPFTYTEGGGGIGGILPTIAINFAHELWLTPSYSYIDLKLMENYSYAELFTRYGGLDIIMHAPLEKAQEQFIPHTTPYMNDKLSYLINPDIREIGIFPSSFEKHRVLCFEDQMVTDFIVNIKHDTELDIDYNVTINDLHAGMPFERILSGEFSNFISSHRVIEWMMKQSVHKFNINNMYFINQKESVEYCVMVNPRSEWILPKIQERLDKLIKTNKILQIMQKYHLISPKV